MKYIKATDVLPVEILEIIQEYIDGEYIYLPRKSEIINPGEKKVV